jgi:hypothetical protein
MSKPVKTNHKLRIKTPKCRFAENTPETAGPILGPWLLGNKVRYGTGRYKCRATTFSINGLVRIEISFPVARMALPQSRDMIVRAYNYARATD